MLDKELFKNLKDLARLEIPSTQEEKIFNDLEKIIDYFNELQKVNTDGVVPMAGGTFLRNVFDEDKRNKDLKVLNDDLKNQFPEEKDDFLKVPYVFE